MLPRLEMIANKNGIKSNILGKLGEVQKLGWTELFSRCFVSPARFSN